MPQTPAEAFMEGPLLGTMFAALLYGVVSMQAYLYFFNYPEDPISIKALVSIIWVLETIHTILSMHFVVHYLIKNFGDVDVLARILWSVVVAPVFAFLIGFIVNLFFVYRIWLLSKKPWVPVLIIVLACTHFGLGLDACARTISHNHWVEFRIDAYPVILAGFIVGVCVDSLITLAVSWELLHARTGARQTNTLINKMLGYALKTGFITSVFGMIELVTFLAIPDTLVFLAFLSVQSKLYANCLLATLNARNHLRASIQSAVLDLSGNSSKNRRRMNAVQTSQLSSGRPIEITTETIVESDNESYLHFGQQQYADPYPNPESPCSISEV